MSFNFDVYSDIPIELRKKYQIVGTPDWYYDLVVKQITIDPKATYLDPCVGRGSGIAALLKAGVKEQQITACDVVGENVAYCRSVWGGVTYLTQDLMTLTGQYDYVVGAPPWIRQLPAMIAHLVFLSSKQCVLMAPFFYGNKRYRSLEPMVKYFCVKDFDTLVRFALSASQHLGAPCIYEFSRVSADGLHNILTDWVSANGLNDYFTFDVKQSVPNNLVLYSGQEFFLPINPVWFLPYTYNGFSVQDVPKFSILGSFKQGRKCYGLVYDSQASLDKAKEHYSSVVVRKMLTCGVDFGWRHLKAV